MEPNSTGGCVKIYFLSLFTSKFYERLPLMAQELPAHNNFQCFLFPPSLLRCQLRRIAFPSFRCFLEWQNMNA